MRANRAKHITEPLVRAYLADILVDARANFRRARHYAREGNEKYAQIEMAYGDRLQAEYRRLCAAERIRLTRYGVPMVDAP